MWLLDLFLLYRLPHPVTRDHLGYLGGKPHFNPPAPPVPPGQVFYGVRVDPVREVGK